MATENNKENKTGESRNRWTLAITMTTVSVVGILIIAIVVIYAATDRAAASQMVLTAVLPVLATWVGTVLAYYFSSESIEAATKSVKTLVSTQEKLQTTAVSDVMIQLHEMIYFTYTDTLTVQEIFTRVEEAGKGSRLPFLGNHKEPIFMIHKSAVDSALVEKTLANEDIQGLTLKTLIDANAELKNLAENTFGVLSIDATLAEVQTVMRSIEKCQDVFITENGKKSGGVVGWVTNGILDRNSKV